MFSASKTAGPSGYNINNSLRFRASASAYLSRTLGSASSRTTWTYSFWIKRGLLGGTYYILSNGNGNANNTEESLYFESTNQLTFINVTQNVAVNWAITTTQVFRDPSAWYHFVIAVDTTQATAANRIKFYVNGSQITSFSSASYPAQNANTTQGASGLTNEIGRRAQVSSNYFDGYYTEFNFVTGQQLTPSSFGSTNATTGVWQPAKYTGTYGTNGFYLPFSDIGLTSGSNTGLGKDFSGNGNYFNTNNISVTAGTTYDAMTDVPTLTSATVANYCVMNPLNKLSAATTSNGNLNVQTSGSSGATINGTFGVSSGKWYWETILNAATDATIFGIDEITELPSYPGVSSTSYSYYPVSALKINNAVQTSYGVTATTNDVIGCALDMDNGKIWWSKNGTWMASGDPVAGTNAAFTGITGTKTPAVGDGSSGSNVNVDYNFGQRPFAYTPPTGFVALNTYNLPDSTVVKGNTVMDATLYTGNGSAQTITNAGGFRPDLVWQKPRSEVASHRLVDSVRGVNNVLYSNQTAAAVTETNTLTAFNSNGFTGGGSNAVTSGNTAVAWQWQAGQGSTSSNTSGSITSTVSVNTTAGFSVVTYTGNGTNNATIGHGLGVAPKMVITKNRATTTFWYVYHSSLPATYNLYLNTTDSQQADNVIRSTSATTFTVSSSSAANGTSMVAYCWAEIAGFSKFGSYTGNGSTDGPFVYTGFRPKYVMIKPTNVIASWTIEDTARSTYNVMDARIFAEESSAELSNGNGLIDYLSNGFKPRVNHVGINGSNNTMIYMAFAENPFKNALAR